MFRDNVIFLFDLFNFNYLFLFDLKLLNNELYWLFDFLLFFFQFGIERFGGDLGLYLYATGGAGNLLFEYNGCFVLGVDIFNHARLGRDIFFHFISDVTGTCDLFGRKFVLLVCSSLFLCLTRLLGLDVFGVGLL